MTLNSPRDLGRSTTPPNALEGVRLLYPMLRVADLERSLRFYVDVLGMHLLRREEYPTGRFTLAFVGYVEEAQETVVELTHNWDTSQYERGNAFGHLALGVADVYAASEQLAAAGAKLVRPPGPMAHRPAHGGHDEHIAFFEDPDGYRVELVQV